jgi:predicted esterase
VQWQLRNHGGFVRSFLSSVRFAPITGQEEAWTRLGKLRNDKVLIIAGTQDPIVIVPEIREDAERLLGKEKVRYKELDSTHDFPINDSKEVVAEIWASWGH